MTMLRLCCVDAGCGGNYTTRTGSIMSQNYPNQYEHNTNCIWVIRSLDNRPITFTYEDFDVEGGGSTCYYDYVAVSFICSSYF